MMMKKRKVLIITSVIIILLFALYYMFGRGNTNALWDIVDKQCVPNQQQNGNPEPCLKVDLNDKYVLFKDSKGPYHDLVMPTDKISGVESTELQQDNVTPFFAKAWIERAHLKEEVGGGIHDEFISLAINSKYGRSQDQLHIHVACLKKEVYEVLDSEKGSITTAWRVFPKEIMGHSYLVKKLQGNDLEKEDPFKIMNEYALGKDDKISNYGIAVSKTSDGNLVLLANRFDLFGFNLGSTGEIQDYNCSLAQ
jgi:CDP-diacylglycerol pyrophosphatase